MYCKNNGPPAIDPVRLFKMLFIGYLFGVRSERQLVREVEIVPMAYLAELTEAIDADRAAHGKKPLKAGNKPAATRPTRTG